MSDQYTRITTGGSVLAKTEPVVGLLFGFHKCNNSAETVPIPPSKKTQSQFSLNVTDAEDVPVDRSENATTQIQLHQAVFPQHVVVGWYRVVAANANSQDGPTLQDLELSQQLQQQYQQQDLQHEITENPFVFALLQVNKEDSSSQNNSYKKNADDHDDNNDDDDDELPLQLFQVDTARGVLVGLDWKLETAPAERIVVERVMRQEEHSNDPTKAHPKFLQATTSLQRSIEALHERVLVLEQFLLEYGTSIEHAPLVRQIYGLLLSVGVIAAASNEGTTTSATSINPCHSNNTNVLLQHVAALTQTVVAVQQYTDKIRAIHTASIAAGTHASASAAGTYP